ncbi:uncharacterized protein SPPG_04065 [Spizellomyces punctatus DAOM BR117]|uniref:Spindle assembly checkpoint component MAD1 n=1 Tax=Spizellomyces punctatus (strain DAOM BR117) TaxID=645134 RepID=A0A0L0HHL6_SPIPD|nr:uncharacterized protein SPPG_04065 [Spizellomyces punctatus DAOM BR117]KND00966.1 hypothetical protein SPPG_04065 [Spizellomyces punctatus DAOM BR117]|eukprot:XP_016609005.1 hypothetical protein SPPG_04065 [Spizellomyces punctatus DAOM BR117]
MFHPYQRSSVRRSPISALNSASVKGNSVVGGQPPSSTGTFRPDNSFSASRSGYGHTTPQTDDIFGEFSSYMSRRELLRSEGRKEQFGASMASRASSPFKRSTTSTGTAASLDLYTDPELLKARKEIRELKETRRKLIDEKANLERKVHDLENSNNEKEAKLQATVLRVDQLEADRQFLLNRSKDLDNRLEAAEEHAITAKKEAELSQSALRRELTELQEKFSLARREANGQLRFKEQETESLEIECDTLSQQLADCEKELRKQIAMVKLGREQLSQMERKYTEAESLIMKLKSNGNAQDEMAVLKRTLDEQIAHGKSLEGRLQELTQQNRYLRDMQENTERLKDEKQALQEQLSRMHRLRGRVDELEVEISQLRSEKARWTKFLDEKDETGIDSPYALSRALAQQRFELAVIKERLGEEEAKRTGRENYILRLENELQEWMQKAKEAEDKRQADAKTLKRVERGRVLAQKEVEFLRSQLKSYDVEEEHLMSQSYDQQKARRISQLEEMVAEYRQEVVKLEEELRQPQTLPSPMSNTRVVGIYSPEVTQRITELEFTIAQLRKENAMLQKEAESLDMQVGELQRALGRGEYDPATTRILQLADNPETREAAIRQSTLDALREENRKLMSRVVELNGAVGKAGSSLGPGMVPLESVRSLEVECNQLKQAVEEKEKRVARLKEVYQAKAQEYREAVYSLLGYKLEIEIDGRVRLTSMYASQDQDPSFVFASGESDQGTMQLVGGAGDAEKRIRAAASYYVEQKGSVPALLAGVTLELFEKSRMQVQEAGG